LFSVIGQDYFLMNDRACVKEDPCINPTPWSAHGAPSSPPTVARSVRLFEDYKNPTTCWESDADRLIMLCDKAGVLARSDRPEMIVARQSRRPIPRHTIGGGKRRPGNSATGMSVALTVVKPGGFMNRLLIIGLLVMFTLPL
jgi:hypothetical protein